MPMKTSVWTERSPGSTRRQFLRRTAAFAAAAAFPRVVPARALGAGGAVAPSERLTLGIIGLGKLGRESHLSSYLGKSQVQVVALNDVETGLHEQSKRHADEVNAKLEALALTLPVDNDGKTKTLFGLQPISELHFDSAVDNASANANRPLY